MIIYLKGYYGHKNFGDELLLLGAISYLKEKYNTSVIYIESQYTERLSSWLSINKEQIPDGVIIKPCKKRSNFFIKRDLTVFGGGEAVTDARGFPYNGRTYMFWFFWTIITGKFIVLGGIGTIRYFSTTMLYHVFLRRAKTIIVRDKGSYEVAKKFNNETHLYHDFAYDVLKSIIKKKPRKQKKCIINCNPYIRSDDTKNKIIDYCLQHPDYKYIYIAAEIGCDDQYFETLKNHIPGLEYYDWTKDSLHEILGYVGSASVGIAARLHILLLLDYFGADYSPLVYQEKITKVLLS